MIVATKKSSAVRQLFRVAEEIRRTESTSRIFHNEMTWFQIATRRRPELLRAAAAEINGETARKPKKRAS